jgi:hypothetical protein
MVAGTHKEPHLPTRIKVHGRVYWYSRKERRFQRADGCGGALEVNRIYNHMGDLRSEVEVLQW